MFTDSGGNSLYTEQIAGLANICSQKCRDCAGVNSKGVRPVKVEALITLDPAKFSGTRAPTRGCGFNRLVCAAGGGSNSFLGQLTGTWIQRWLLVK